MIKCCLFYIISILAHLSQSLSMSYCDHLPSSISPPHYENMPIHYENTPIQIYRKFHLQKTENFQLKKSDIFHISAQNIDGGYSLEPPHRGGSNEYP